MTVSIQGNPRVINLGGKVRINGLVMINGSMWNIASTGATKEEALKNFEEEIKKAVK